MRNHNATGRRGALVGMVVLGIALGVAVWRTTPWTVIARPPGGYAPATVSPYFTAAQQARDHAFQASAVYGTYGGLVAGLLVAAVIGLTPAGRWVVRTVARPLGGGWVWQVLLGSIALAAIGQLVALPFSIYVETVLLRYGLSTESWPA